MKNELIIPENATSLFENAISVSEGLQFFQKEKVVKEKNLKRALDSVNQRDLYILVKNARFIFKNINKYLIKEFKIKENKKYKNCFENPKFLLKEFQNIEILTPSSSHDFIGFHRLINEFDNDKDLDDDFYETKFSFLFNFIGKSYKVVEANRNKKKKK